MKIVFYNETLMSGGIEKCLELLSKELCPKYEIEIVYVDDTKLDENIVNILSKHAYVHKLNENDVITADICVWCRIYLYREELPNQIIAPKNILWVHSKPRALPNCILDSNEFMSKIDKIVCVSQAVEDEVNMPNKTIVIHNFVDRNIKELSENISNPLSDIPDDYLKLLIVGRLSLEKGFERVDKFINDLTNVNPNFVLNVIGKGRKAVNHVKDLLSKYNKVNFLGYMDNPYPYVKNSDYLLVLSDYESWGNVISEAKVLGTPCIVTDFPSAKEQIENDKSGIVVPLETDNYAPYLQNLKQKSVTLKANLKNFEYPNEIDKWLDVLK